MDKRHFLKNMVALTAGTSLFRNLDEWTRGYEMVAPETLASDEDFWARIRSGYRLKPDYINLENGYYCFIPQETLENLIQHIRHVNYEGSYYMRTVQRENKNYVCQRLAELFGAEADEVILTRNTTESLDTVIAGVHWKAGDEAVFAEQDYGAMQNQFKLMAHRYGIVNKIISIPNHPESDEQIVALYREAITDRTRLLMLCHMINITGHILPVRKIVDMAHERGVEVMVDGAHAYGHIVFDIKDLDCDYYGSSLHKWLSAPLGSGLLFAKREKTKNIWPLFADSPDIGNDLNNLNHTGTHPVHTDLAVINALEYHQRIGPRRKEARLRFLQKYWTDQARSIEGVVVNTPSEPQRACGIANVGINGMKPADMAKKLLEEYRIWTVAIDGRGVKGCRITPNIYTTTRELDQLVNALKSMVKT